MRFCGAFRTIIITIILWLFSPGYLLAAQHFTIIDLGQAQVLGTAPGFGVDQSDPRSALFQVVDNGLTYVGPIRINNNGTSVGGIQHPDTSLNSAAKWVQSVIPVFDFSVGTAPPVNSLDLRSIPSFGLGIDDAGNYAGFYLEQLSTTEYQPQAFVWDSSASVFEGLPTIAGETTVWSYATNVVQSNELNTAGDALKMRIVGAVNASRAN